jgi:hypothetical protein
MSSESQPKSTAELWKELFNEWYNKKIQDQKEEPDTSSEQPPKVVKPDDELDAATQNDLNNTEAGEDANNIQIAEQTKQKEINALKLFKEAINRRKDQKNALKTIILDTITRLINTLEPIPESVKKINTDFTSTKKNIKEVYVNPIIKNTTKINVIKQSADGLNVSVNEDSLINRQEQVKEAYHNNKLGVDDFNNKYDYFSSQMELFGKSIQYFNERNAPPRIGVILVDMQKIQSFVERESISLKQIEELNEKLTQHVGSIEKISKDYNSLVNQANAFNEQKDAFEKNAKNFQKAQDETIAVMKKLIKSLKVLSNPKPQSRSLITYIETTELNTDGDPIADPANPIEQRIQSQHKLNVWITPRESFIIENFLFSYSIMKKEKITGGDVYFVIETFTISKTPLYINDKYQSISPQLRFLVIYKNASAASSKKYDKWYLTREEAPGKHKLYSMEIAPSQEMNTYIHRKEATDPIMKKKRDDKNTEILYENIYGISKAKLDEIYGYCKTILKLDTPPPTKPRPVILKGLSPTKVNNLPSATIKINFNDTTMRLVKFAESFKDVFSTSYTYEKYGNKDDINDKFGKQQMDTGKISDYELLTLVDDEFTKDNGKGFDDLVQDYKDATSV